MSSGTPFLSAAEDLKRIATMFAGLSKLGEELGRVGSLANAADEAEDRIVKAKDELAAVHGDIEQAGQTLDDTQATMREQISKAQAQLDALRVEMQRERDACARDCETMREVARTQANDIVAAANREADEHIRETQATMRDLEQQIASKQKALGSIEAAIAAGQDQLSRINEALAQARSRLGL